MNPVDRKNEKRSHSTYSLISKQSTGIAIIYSIINNAVTRLMTSIMKSEVSTFDDTQSVVSDFGTLLTHCEESMKEIFILCRRWDNY